ncbi:MAG: PAS domain S-box protein [Acidimicrobiia bacterium]
MTPDSTHEHQHEHQWRELLGTELDVVVVADDEGVLRWASDAAGPVLGWSSDELLGRVAADLVHPDDRAALRASLVAAVADPGTAVTLDAFRVRSGDGTDRWVSGRWRAIDGECAGRSWVVASLRDVEELVQTRRIAEADREHLRATLDSLLDPHVVLVPIRDEGGHVVDFFVRDANPAAAVDTDFASPPLTGARASYTLPPAMADIAIRWWARVLRTGEPLVLDDFEYHHELTDGTTHRYDVRAARIGDTIAITWRDVTERSASRRDLAESEARYRRLAENASDVVLETVPDGTIEWVSPSVERVLGYEPATLAGTSILDFVEDADQAQVIAWRDEANAGSREAGELRVRAHDGELHWMSFRVQPLLGDDGQVQRGVVTLRLVDDEVVERRAAATLATVSAILVRAEEEHELLHDVCEAAAGEGGYRLAWYGRPLDDRDRTVEVTANSQANADYLEGIRISWGDGPLGRGPSGRAIRTGETVIVHDFAHEPDFAPWRATAARHGFRSSIGVPVLVEGEVDGALMVYAAEPHAFGPRAVDLLQSLAAELGYGLERLRDRNRLDGALRNAVDLLAATVESRDPYTAGHQGQVALLAVEIGRELGFDRRRLEGLRYAANVHDLGKIAVPSAILDKPGRLTDEEFAVVRCHPTVGAEIARRFDWPWPIVDVIEQHHERWDGTGYPHGVAGERIVLDARVVAVADAFEAIAAARPYREALGYEEARRIVEEECGSHFDPTVVAAFLRVLDAGFSFPRLRHA